MRFRYKIFSNTSGFVLFLLQDKMSEAKLNIRSKPPVEAGIPKTSLAICPRLGKRCLFAAQYFKGWYSAHPCRAPRGPREVRTLSGPTSGPVHGKSKKIFFLKSGPKSGLKFESPWEFKKVRTFVKSGLFFSPWIKKKSGLF